MIRTCPATLLPTRDALSSAPRPDRDAALHRVRPGVYVRRADWETLAPWERYLTRVHAVARTWTDPLFCLESAAALQGLPIFGEPRHIHLLSGDGRTWRRGDVVVHGTKDNIATVLADGIRVTAPVETVVDLCRVLPPAFALAQADAALRSMGRVGMSLDLAAHGRLRSSRRGLRQLDWVQARATPVAESAGESVSRAVIEWLGYEMPELQVEFRHEGARDRTDFYWRRLRIVGESDGYGKYETEDPEETKVKLIDEKKREDRLRRHEGGMARWDWTDTVRWRPLDGKLRATGLAPCRPVHQAMLATLASNPRSIAPAANPSKTSPRTGRISPNPTT